MTRLTLTMRLSLILVLSISAIWLVAVALYYRSVPSSLERAKPSSERLAAIAELLETTPNERRGLVLAALTTDTFAPRLESLEDALDATAARPKPKLFRDAALEEFYVKGLGGRPVAFSELPAPNGAWFLRRIVSAKRNALEIRIALRTGEVLAVDARAPVVTTPFGGVPVGFGAGLFGTFVALLALLLMHIETRPIRRLAAAVERMDLSGELTPLPKARRSSVEIRALIGAFEHSSSAFRVCSGRAWRSSAASPTMCALLPRGCA